MARPQADPKPQPQPETDPPQDDSARGRQTSQPECPYHPGTRCKSGGSAPYFTRYYCPVDGCPFSIKVPKPVLAKPREEGEEFSAR